MNETPVIRIVKKKQAHIVHHGGSWKVAYADFVTAMMAFFLVMWIISMNDSMRDEIQNYFNNPSAAGQSKAGIARLASGGISPIAAGTYGMGAKNWTELALEAQRDRLNRVQEKLQTEIARRPDLSHLGKHVEIAVTSAGLDIELIEASESLFFRSGSADLPPATVKLLGVIAHELGRLPNPIAIEGHTDSVAYQAHAGYTNWELSTDRANAARRTMEANGLRLHQVVEVRGYADSKPRDAKHPANPINRRVSILLNLVNASATGTGTSEPADPPHMRLPFSISVRPELSSR
jgi:chemotaxis protein MotB